MTSEFDVLYTLWNNHTSGVTDSRFIEEQWTARFLRQETANIKQKITLRAYQYEDDKSKVKSYIVFLQKMLLKLEHEIRNFSIFFEQLNDAVDEIILFLMEDFHQHFDYTRIATASYRIQVLNEQAVIVRHLKAFLGATVLEGDLAELIQQYLEGRDHAVETYAQLRYYQLFCQEMLRWFITNPEKHTQLTLVAGLIFINFNAPQFIAYLKNKVRRGDTRGLDYPAALKECLKNLRNIQHIADQHVYAYDRQRGPVKQSVIHLIETELNFIKSLQANDIQSVNAVQAGTPAAAYLKADMTVGQIAFLFRLLVEEKVIAVQHMNDLFIFLCNHIRTPNTGNELSFGSVKNKYYEVTDHSRNHVKSVLMRMFNRACKDSK